MKEVEGEAMRLSLPDRFLRIEADVAILIIGELVQAWRHRDLFFDERLLGACPRKFQHKIVAERFRLAEKLDILRCGFEETRFGGDPQYRQPLQCVQHATSRNAHSTQLLVRLNTMPDHGFSPVA